MKTPVLQTAIAVSCVFLSTGCDTPEGANALAGMMPRVNVRGPGFARSYGVPSDVFKSPRLKFQEAVVRGDVATATRHMQPNLVNEPIKGYPPIYYAAIGGHSAMIRLLVQNGASVSRHFGGRSLAYLAAAYGHRETAADIIALGGGSSSDIASGHALYAENEAAQRRQAAAMMTGALLLLNAAMSSGSGSGGGGYDQQLDTYNALHHDAAIQRAQGIETHSIY